MRRIIDTVLGIPPRRAEQFRLIESARKRLLKWTSAEGLRLVHVEYVVPFVETDFSLWAWLFYRAKADVDSYAADGTSDRLKERLKADLDAVGYPAEWQHLVQCRFASKEEVDERYEGNYYYYVR